MPRPSKKTPKKIATARAMHAKKKPLREIASAVGVSPDTVRLWLAPREKSFRTGSPSGNRTRTKPDAKPDSALEREVAETVARPLPSPGSPEALDEVRSRLALVRGLLARMEPGVETGDVPATQFVTVAKYGDELTRLLVELSPAPPRDPEQDSDVIEAERVLLARIADLVAQAEARQR